MRKILLLVICVGVGSDISAQSRSRDEVIQDYQNHFLSVEVEEADGQWRGGSIEGCQAGDISKSIREKVLQHINYFRRQVGYTEELQLASSQGQQKAQAAALIIRANRSLNHIPDSRFTCYTKAGKEASTGNIGITNQDIGMKFVLASVKKFMQDEGKHNLDAGHRSWFLYAGINKIAVGGTHSSVTIWWEEKKYPPFTEVPEFVSWPPKGYVVSELVFSRWSFQVHTHKVTARRAVLSMQEKATGKPVALKILYRRKASGIIPSILFTWVPSISYPQNQKEEITYVVNIKDVLVQNELRNFTYEVTIITP